MVCRSVNVKNVKRRSKIILLIGLLLIMGISTIGFSFKFYSLEETSRKMERIERAIQDLRAAMNVDSIRQYNIQKVMKIIDLYNPNMPSSLKYDVASEIYTMAMKYTNLDVDLICATITHESARTWNPRIVSEAGAMGLMQIMPATGILLAQFEGVAWTSAEEVLFNPIYNIRMGTRHLSTLIDLYGVDGGLAAYNGGEKIAARWLANNKADGILWPETKDYVPAILKLYEKFKD